MRCSKWILPVHGKEVLLFNETEQHQWAGGWRLCRSPRDSGRFLHRLHHVLFCFLCCCCKTFCWGGVSDKQRLCRETTTYVQQIASKSANESGRADRDSTTWIPLALFASATVVLQNPSSSSTTLVLMTDGDNCRSGLRLFPMERSYCSHKTDNGVTDARGGNHSGHHL